MQHPNENQGWLEDIAVKAGALRRCERHHLVFGGPAESDTAERAYKMAATAWKAQSAGCSLPEFKDQLKRLMDHAPSTCGLCEKDK